MKRQFYSYLFCFLITMSACHNEGSNGNIQKESLNGNEQHFDIVGVEEILKEKFDSNSREKFYVWEDDTVDKKEIFSEIYDTPTPLWVNENGFRKQVNDLFVALRDLEFDGLNLQKYRIEELEKIRQSMNGNSSKEELFSLEMKMTNSFLEAMKDMVFGAIENKNQKILNHNDTLVNLAQTLKLILKGGNIQLGFEMLRPLHPWYQKFREEYVSLGTQKIMPIVLSGFKDSITIGDSLAEIVKLRKRLNQEIKLPADTNSALWAEDVVEGLKKYQYLNSLKPNGKLDSITMKKLNTLYTDKLKKIALNMERMRWLKMKLKQPFVWVDIPWMQLEYYDKDSVQFKMNVVVGKPARTTYALDALLSNLVLSPPWIVPPTILREDVLPGVMRRGGSYLARKGLRAYDSRGRAVSASAIHSGNYRSFSFSQAPGYNSSLGEVKFNMPNPWSIYMHDTPHREDFVKTFRALSSGCVRVQRPKDFATFLLQDSIHYSYQKIDSICKLRKTITIPMKREIGVHFVYLTNAVDSAGNVLYLKDVYGWDAL